MKSCLRWNRSSSTPVPRISFQYGAQPVTTAYTPWLSIDARLWRPAAASILSVIVGFQPVFFDGPRAEERPENAYMHLHSKERGFGLRCFITLCELAVSILHEAGGRDGGASPRIATLPGEHGEHPGIARRAKGDLTLDAVRTIRFDINQPESMAHYYGVEYGWPEDRQVHQARRYDGDTAMMTICFAPTLEPTRLALLGRSCNTQGPTSVFYTSCLYPYMPCAVDVGSSANSTNAITGPYGATRPRNSH
ncbi:hypothetical protein EIP86_009174 [Pleurotus ostreatoroseus]|nr:hypothetical protein EIP86_009174 [Pleurotus ostreatoroseus]